MVFSANWSDVADQCRHVYFNNCCPFKTREREKKVQYEVSCPKKWKYGEVSCWLVLKNLYIPIPKMTKRRHLWDASVYQPFLDFDENLLFKLNKISHIWKNNPIFKLNLTFWERTCAPRSSAWEPLPSLNVKEPWFSKLRPICKATCKFFT